MNLRTFDRNQTFVMVTSMREWVPADHVAWIVLECVEQLDLAPLYAKLRVDGRGGASYDPAVMMATLLYAQIDGVRASRDIEDHCRTDVVYRMLCGDQAPDHTTITRFRKRNHTTVRDLFAKALTMCHLSGLVDLRKTFVDGTKIDANASLSANHTLEQVETLVDALMAEEAAADARDDDDDDPDTPAQRRGRSDRADRLDRARRQLEATQAERRSTADEEAKPAKANTSDPDSRIMKTRKGYLQGYNAQALVTVGQVIVAAQVTNQANDYAQLHPMIELGLHNRIDAGIRQRIKLVCGDAGYMSEANVATAPDHYPLLLLATSNNYNNPDPPPARPGSEREHMNRTLASEAFREIYDLRKTAVEPVFGNAKHNRGFTSFLRRGLDAANADWILEAAALNLKKLHTERQRLRRSLTEAITTTKPDQKPTLRPLRHPIRSIIRQLTPLFQRSEPRTPTQPTLAT